MIKQGKPERTHLAENLKVFMLSWEFPPRVIGGIAAHVHDLSIAMNKLGIDVTVVTCDFPDAQSYEEVAGVHVHRVDSYKFPTPNFASWVFMMNLNMQRYAVELVAKEVRRGTDILIHCHDWLVANAAISLKHIFRMPLLATIHSTEYGRRRGIHSDYQRLIHQAEAWLTKEAWRVICCSNYMASQVSTIFHLPRTKIDVIPNAVNATNFMPTPSRRFRPQFAKDDEKLILYVGRLVYEKGVSVLIDSVNRVLQRVNAKFVIVGDGYMKDRLIDQTHRLGVSRNVYFTSFLNSQDVKGLYKVADVCVVPSLYEPFGIVALEAMASQTPVVASDVGGLSEIIAHDETGISVYPGDPESLARGIIRLLEDDGYSRRLSRNGFLEVVNRYDWGRVAEETWNVCNRVFTEYEKGAWKPSQV
jgi:glycogen(starch) synthase